MRYWVACVIRTSHLALVQRRRVLSRFFVCAVCSAQSKYIIQSTIHGNRHKFLRPALMRFLLTMSSSLSIVQLFLICAQCLLYACFQPRIASSVSITLDTREMRKNVSKSRSCRIVPLMRCLWTVRNLWNGSCGQMIILIVLMNDD
jgi:hypothetical protein